MSEPVRLNARVYRVHVEGMNPTESKIFAGMIHLAERNGTVFQIEPVLEQSDIFIFDGSNAQAIEFERSHPQLTQRAIWINPPSHLQSPRQISRPFRWSALLAMMEQIVSATPSAAVAQQGQPPEASGFERLCAVTEQALRKHIGIAAGFVIEDVRAERSRLGGGTTTLSIEAFLDILRPQLPTSVDAGAVIREISAAARLSGPA